MKRVLYVLATAILLLPFSVWVILAFLGTVLYWCFKGEPATMKLFDRLTTVPATRWVNLGARL